MKKIRDFFTEPFFWCVIIPIILLILLLLGRNFGNQNALENLRVARKMIFIEEGLVYQEDTHVLYQEVPVYECYSIAGGFYVPFYDENGEVIIFNN